MKTFTPLLVLCAGNSRVTGEFPSQRPVTRCFDVFFYLRQNKRCQTVSLHWDSPRSCFNNKDCLFICVFTIIKIRRSYERLIFIMGIPILVRRHIYIETVPCLHCQNYFGAASAIRSSAFWHPPTSCMWTSISIVINTVINRDIPYGCDR